MKYISTIALLTIFFILIVSCSQQTHNNRRVGEVINKDSVVIRQTELLIKKYNNKHFQSSKIDLYIPDTTIVECFYEKISPKILRLNTYTRNEERAADFFTTEFYFGEEMGFPIIYTTSLKNGEISRQVIMKDRYVVSYLKKDGKVTYINQLDSFEKESKISALMFIMVSTITHFSNLNYQIVSPSIANSMPVMTILRNGTSLYKEHNINSKIVQHLNEDEHLFFIDYFKEVDVITGNSILWYKVATEDTKIFGWIIDDEKKVKYYSDGG